MLLLQQSNDEHTAANLQQRIGLLLTAHVEIHRQVKRHTIKDIPFHKPCSAY